MTFKKSRIKELLAMTEKEINANCKDFTEKDWYAISWKRKKMSANFLKKHANKLNWNWVCEYCKMDTKTLRKVDKYLDWDQVSRYQKLDEEFINDYSDKLNWNWISKKRKINMDTIRANGDDVNWNTICAKKKLSEDFILENIDKVNWKALSSKQKFSQKFILQFKDKINWENENFYKNNTISHDTFMKCMDVINFDYIFRIAWRNRNKRHDRNKEYYKYMHEAFDHRLNDLNQKEIDAYVDHLQLTDEVISTLAPKFSNDNWNSVVRHKHNRRHFKADFKKQYKKQIADAIKRVDEQDERDYWNSMW